MIVTVEADHTPPRVRIDTTAPNVYRVDGTVRTQVRGGVVEGVAYDYECPQETVVTYDDLLAVSGPVEMPDVGPWLVPVSLPESGAPLIVTEFSGWNRPGNVSVAEIPGRANPVAVSFRRGGRRGTIEAATLTVDDFEALSVALDVTGPAFLSMPSSHWPAFGLVSSYVVVGDVGEKARIGADDPVWIVTLPLTPVDRPVFVVATGSTWADEVGTWAAAVGDWTA